MIEPAGIRPQNFFVEDSAGALVDWITDPYPPDIFSFSAEFVYEILPERFVNLFGVAVCCGADDCYISFSRFRIGGGFGDILLHTEFEGVFLRGGCACVPGTGVCGAEGVGFDVKDGIGGCVFCGHFSLSNDDVVCDGGEARFGKEEGLG